MAKRRYGLDSPSARPRSDGGGGDGSAPLWTQVDALMQKGFPATPAKEDSKYPDPIYYLPYVPVLDIESDARITPPQANDEYLATAYMVDVEKGVAGVSARLPWDLRHVPMHPSSYDTSIEDTINPGRYNTKDDGSIKWARKYFLLVMRVDGDRDAQAAVLMLGPKQMNELCSQLALHRKYIDNLIGVPMTIVNRGGAVEVDPQPSQPKLDMSVLKSRTDDGELVLEEYLSAVREEYEKFLLDNGYECQTTDDGERYAWRYTGRRADTSGFVPEDQGTPPWEDVPAAAQADDYSEYTKAQLRDVVNAAGLDVKASASRQEMIDAIEAAK